MYYINILINQNWEDKQLQAKTLRAVKELLLELSENKKIRKFRIDRDERPLMFVSNDEWQMNYFMENVDKIDARLK